jgi:hypothetical protein
VNLNLSVYDNQFNTDRAIVCSIVRMVLYIDIGLSGYTGGYDLNRQFFPFPNFKLCNCTTYLSRNCNNDALVEHA